LETLKDKKTYKRSLVIMPVTQLDYMKKWLELNAKMERRNFTWGALEEENDYHQYMSFNVLKFKQQQWDAIQVATEKIGHIMNKTYQIVVKNPSLIKNKLGLPVETLDAVQVPSEYFSYFTRFDLILNGDNIKVIEANCDTPTGYLETSVANEIICREQGLVSPNMLEVGIFRAWRYIEKEYGITKNDRVYFASYGEHEEDRQTVLFNMRNSNLNNTEYIAVEDIQIDEDGLYDTEGNPIKFLYRLYPLEFLPEDIDGDGKEIGKMFLDHIATGKVKIINPPSAFLMQTKAIMGVIWSFVDENRTDLFTEEELSDIRTYFLPTYFENRFEGKKHVRKPIFGREGGGVHIFDESQNIIDKDAENWYDKWNKIYQEYVEMPDYTLDTWDGKYTGKLLVGSFLVGKQPSGVFLRVGEKITGNLSMFCGVAVE
jgi:glutathionylspermidine synthase